MLKRAIQNLLGSFMGDIEREFKAKPIDLTGAKDQIETLKGRAQTSIKKLRRIVDTNVPEEAEVISDLEQTLLELSVFAEHARARIEQVEEEGRQMVDMAGVGLMVEVVAHELARSSENALKALEYLKSTEVPERLRGHLRGCLENRFWGLPSGDGGDSRSGCGHSRAGVAWPGLPGRRSVIRRI